MEQKIRALARWWYTRGNQLTADQQEIASQFIADLWNIISDEHMDDNMPHEDEPIERFLDGTPA